MTVQVYCKIDMRIVLHQFLRNVSTARYIVQNLTCLVIYFGQVKAPVVMSFFVNIVLGEALRPSLQQLCANVLGHLNTKGLYPSLKVMNNKTLYCNSTAIALGFRVVCSASYLDHPLLTSVFQHLFFRMLHITRF